MRGARRSIRSCRVITSNKHERGPSTVLGMTDEYERRSPNPDRGRGQESAQPRRDERRGSNRYDGQRGLRRHVADVGEIQGGRRPQGDRSRDVPDFRLPNGDRSGERRDGDARGKNYRGSEVDVGRRTCRTARAVTARENSLRAVGRGCAALGLERRRTFAGKAGAKDCERTYAAEPAQRGPGNRW